jgi:hypothetical protein
MEPVKSRWIVIALAAFAAIASPRAAYAQQMNFSYYSDAVVDAGQQVVYTIIDGYDNSTGCTHYGYQSVGYVSAPTGNYQESFGGLSTYIAIPVSLGNFSFSSSASVNCSCFGSGLGAGGGWAAGASQAYLHQYYRSGSTSNYYPEINSMKLKCSHSRMTWNGHPPDSKLMSDDGLYYSLMGRDVACLSVCMDGHTGPAAGPAGTQLGPASCD